MTTEKLHQGRSQKEGIEKMNVCTIMDVHNYFTSALRNVNYPC